MTIKEKKKIKNAVLRLIKDTYENIEDGKKANTKLKNVCDKTGQYDIPSELYQKRTLRKNRVLLPWKDVKNNELTVEQLESFSGGVAVEFVNEDYFTDPNDLTSELRNTFEFLKTRIGSDENVSAIISFRSESGSSSSKKARQYYDQMQKNTKVIYRGTEIEINPANYDMYLLKNVEGKERIKTGNDTWSGFLFHSIRGGKQEAIESHPKKELRLFNPACEFATENVSLDIDLVMLYFAVFSIDKSKLKEEKLQKKYDKNLNKIKNALSEAVYESEDYKGNLLNYCNSHLSVVLDPGYLTDPIQARKIYIEDFSIDDKNDERNIDFTHSEAVKKKKFYWDEKQQCILSAARPANIFWSKHASNMMQQDMRLDQYFQFEADNIKRRKKLLKKIKIS